MIAGMSEARTVPTEVPVDDFLAAVAPAARREEGAVLDRLFRSRTGVAPRMWGPSIVGYGEYRTVYESGWHVHGPRCGFSPRRAKHALYLIAAAGEEEEAAYAPLLARLGKHSRGRACLYVNRLADIDTAVLEEMIALSWRRSRERHPA